VKIVRARAELAGQREKGEPYKGAKPIHIVDEGRLSKMDLLPSILFAIAESLPVKKTSKSRK
jgi:hypothetical protein